MNHNYITSTDRRMIPFQMEVVDDLDNISKRIETHDAITWHVLNGTPITRSCWDAINLPDPELAALCAAYRIYAPLSAVRADPIRYLGPWASVVLTPDNIPRCIRRTARLRA